MLDEFVLDVNIGQDRDVLEHRLAAVAEAGRFHAATLRRGGWWRPRWRDFPLARP
ncbi:hypothetical protein [Reyranella sp.]|uniref:hypothetical protein n=1 Tax=Hyphomicrobiales TaxID=356 RepID=UPI0026241848|nr:hypothetical protein [Reyranella sp.]MDX3805878.1 hypothetical protein [Bosea sp. (in: a-proteobacteria)]